MAEVFRGWRRRTGVVTLLAALALMGMWLRSSRSIDELRFGSGNETTLSLLRASCDGITWERQSAVQGVVFIYNPGLTHWTITDLGFRIGGDLGISPQGSSPSFGGPFDTTDVFHVSGVGFEVSVRHVAFGEKLFDSADAKGPNQFRKANCTIPWWSIVVPLTLTSAYLLLNKPAKKPTAQKIP